MIDSHKRVSKPRTSMADKRLDWCREHIPGFREAERSALAVHEAVEQNRREMGVKG